MNDNECNCGNNHHNHDLAKAFAVGYALDVNRRVQNGEGTAGQIVESDRKLVEIASGMFLIPPFLLFVAFVISSNQPISARGTLVSVIAWAVAVVLSFFSLRSSARDAAKL